MIEINGIYKLKKIRNFECLNDQSDYKVVSMNEKYVICENLETDERFFFFKDFLIDLRHTLSGQRILLNLF